MSIPVDPVLLVLLAGAVAAIIVAAAVPRFRAWALATLVALGVGTLTRFLDRFAIREDVGRRDPAPEPPDEAQEAAAAAQEAEAVADAQEDAVVPEEERREPPDIDSLVARANARRRSR